MNKKTTLYLPFNLGSGNRGCEGIVKGIHSIMGEEFRYTLLDRDIEEKERDIFMGIETFADIYVNSNLNEFGLITRYLHKIIRRLGFRKEFYKIFPYLQFFQECGKNDIILFTGGDLFCYDFMSSVNASLHKEMKKRNLNTVLYGCSISENYLSNFVLEQLRRFDLIICRENISVNNLKKHGIIHNVLNCPDPAFVLAPEKCSLPKCFQEEVVGINLSSLVGFITSMDSMYARNIKRLLEYILDYTEYHILFIPHVTWKEQDDREICQYFYELYRDSGRVSYLDIVELSYMKIRYVISRCSMFIGARTHSVISAYSTYVPALALGYSVKSVGIARDLAIEENYVLDCKNLGHEYEMVEKYKILQDNKENFKKHLIEVIPKYRERAFDGAKAIKQIINQ